MDLFKKKVKKSFDKGAQTYDDNSGLQKEILENLLDFFSKEIKGVKKDFTLLEIGSGTGIFSKKISQSFSLKNIHLLDISSQMINKSKLNFKSDKVLFINEDFDFFKNYNNYNLIVSNMSIHWSSNFIKLIKSILKSINKDSIILMSFPNSNSFSDIKRKYKTFTNDFPNNDELKLLLNNQKYYFNLKNLNHKKEFKSMFVFLKSLKKIGANASKKKTIFRDLYNLRKDNEKVIINFDITYLLIRKL